MIHFRTEIDQIFQHLVGGTIVGIIATPDEECYGFQVRLPGGTMKYVWVDKDTGPGAGPGHLTIADSINSENHISYSSP